MPLLLILKNKNCVLKVALPKSLGRKGSHRDEFSYLLKWISQNGLQVAPVDGCILREIVFVQSLKIRGYPECN